jgi:hypothetical protein
MLLVGLLALPAAPSHAAQAQAPDKLPDTPQAQQTTPSPQTAPADPKAVSPLPHESFERRKWSAYVDPHERVPTLNAKDKMLFWLHEEFQITSPLPALAAAGYEQALNTDPKYGTDSGAFGERLAAGLVREASMRFLSDSVGPSLTHEDPRYYRLASGSYVQRGLHAAEFAFVGRDDRQQRTFNKSNIFGHLAAATLTLAYYPHVSRNSRVVFETWGRSVAGSAGDNLFLEFWPDVVNKFFKGHHRQ